GTRPSMPASSWRSTRFRSAVSSIAPSRNGVTSAVRTPSNTSIPSDREAPFEDVGSRTGHLDVRVVGGPGDLEAAASQPDPQLAREPAACTAAKDGYPGSRAGPAAAGQRLAGASLPGALQQAVAAARRDELDIDAVRKGRIALDRRPEPLDRRRLRILDEEHR